LFDKTRLAMSATEGVDRLPRRPTEAPRLYAVVYVSTAARALSADELAHIGHRSQVRNVAEGVTGLLLHANGAFMQYLEGPAAGLSRVYAVIKTDPQHYGVIDLLREPVPEREFAGWTMAVRDVGARGQASAAQQYGLLSGQPEPRVAPSAARQLLVGFWSRGRPSVAPTLRAFSDQRARRVSAVAAA
jgi:hypothetical protein